ncbi:hypothetical protein [Herbaspirillum sp. NPDC101396]|uniref:hypothetical protein n=1 Tax=Herbaspirillum sp. NPDC101396 TaxID=3364005 RepID=UPI00383A0988
MSNTNTVAKSVKTDEPAIANHPRFKSLEGVVYDVDAMSQSGFDRIEAIAKLISISLESPSGYFPPHISTISHAMDAIRAIAEEASNCINSRAEEVGCNYVDDGIKRRFDAEKLGKQQWQNILSGSAS